MRILAIDPGPSESGYVLMNGDKIQQFGKALNIEVLAMFRLGLGINHCVCERIRSYGMPAGAELFETCEWSGRYWQAAVEQSVIWSWLTRRDVKLHLCGNVRAKDGNIRQAIIDRFGGKSAAIGTKKTPGPLLGVSGDVWAALGVAITWQDLHRGDTP
mgnify:CR=1 FL=1